ncbi:MAG: aminotransferase class IV [Actinomycetota bacterium]
MAVIGSVLIDGRAVAPSDAVISVFDIGFQRGYGCFEAMRSYGGSIFRLDAHLDRLAGSSKKLRIPVPDRDAVSRWCRAVAEPAGDCVVRVFVSGGLDATHPGTESRVVAFAESVPALPDGLALQTRVAPWHTDGEWFELTGAKALSYGFNLAASVAANDDGFDDALLIGITGMVLEGPTYSIGWIVGNGLFTPGLEIGILESITRRTVIEVADAIGMTVHEGRYSIEDVLGADEVVAMSTTREVLPVTTINDDDFAPGPGTKRLQDGFSALVDRELGR